MSEIEWCTQNFIEFSELTNPFGCTHGSLLRTQISGVLRSATTWTTLKNERKVTALRRAMQVPVRQLKAVVCITI